MTNRCRVLIILGIIGMVLGVLRDQSSLATLSLAVLVWLFLVWLHFQLRLGLSWPKLKLNRSVNGRSHRHTTLWSDRPITMSVEISASGGKIPAVAVVRDLLPPNVLVESRHATTAIIEDSSMIRMQYNCCCPAAGRVSFFGVHFRFQDPQGLFLSERVLRDEIQFRVLPSFTQAKDARSHIKRINSIPQHGIHQLQRAGLGSELLELREYQPGDPPKSIAWKVSARRGQLMTRQYESEVPVKVTILLDVSERTRWGTLGQRPLDQLTNITATIAKTAISVGDSIGMILVDKEVRRRMRPASGDRAFYKVLEALADFSIPAPGGLDHLPVQALDTVIDLCRERYPEFIERRLESRSFSLLPIRPAKRRRLQARRQLAAILSELYQLSPTQQVELTFDDRVLANVAQRWAHEHDVLLPSPQNANRGQTEASARFELLSRELTRAIAYANDNELFVLIVDMLDAEDEIEPLVSAAKVAMARHHPVVFVCPLPPGVTGKAQAAETPPQTMEELYRQVTRINTLEKSREFKARLRSTGAAVAFVSERNLISVVMNEAELAGSGRYKAGMMT